MHEENERCPSICVCNCVHYLAIKSHRASGTAGFQEDRYIAHFERASEIGALDLAD